MKIVTNKKLNLKKIYYFVSVVLVIVIILVIGIKVYFDFFRNDEKPTQTRENLDTLELYGYTLDDEDTELYKTYFNELKKVLSEEEIDEEKYASLLVQLFIVDVYNLDNKLTSTDIGGLEYIHADMVENFKINLGDTMYNTIESNLYGDRIQVLPIVSNVNIDGIEEYTYQYDNKDYSGYLVNASWEYENDLGYENQSSFILINDNNKLNIVEKIDGEL